MSLDYEIEIWMVDFDREHDKLKDYQLTLNDQELQRASQFKFDSLKSDFIICRGFVKTCLAKYLDTCAQAVNFSYLEKGKPFLEKDPSLHFNISHSGRKGVLAVTKNQRVGIDIEKHQINISFKKLASRFFSKNESNVICQMDGEKLCDSFYRCWTRKESFIKATGDGLSFPLELFEVNFSDQQPARLLNTFWNPEEKQKWQLFNLELPGGYSGAIASESINKVLRYQF